MFRSMPLRPADRALHRRALLRLAAAWSLPIALPAAAQSAPGLLTRAIPSSGEALPLVGLGSWITFNVGNDPLARERCVRVLRDFFAAGGRMIDSSPMYGSSQPVIGAALEQLQPGVRLWSPPARAASRGRRS